MSSLALDAYLLSSLAAAQGTCLTMGRSLLGGIPASLPLAPADVRSAAPPLAPLALDA
jgi:hypothetical protein